MPQKVHAGGIGNGKVLLKLGHTLKSGNIQLKSKKSLEIEETMKLEETLNSKAVARIKE